VRRRCETFIGVHVKEEEEERERGEQRRGSNDVGCGGCDGCCHHGAGQASGSDRADEGEAILARESSRMG